MVNPRERYGKNDDSEIPGKANDSFKTKLNLNLFSKAIQQYLININLEDFKEFEISQELIALYATKYWQDETDYEHKLVVSK